MSQKTFKLIIAILIIVLLLTLVVGAGLFYYFNYYGAKIEPQSVPIILDSSIDQPANEDAIFSVSGSDANIGISTVEQLSVVADIITENSFSDNEIIVDIKSIKEDSHPVDPGFGPNDFYANTYVPITDLDGGEYKVFIRYEGMEDEYLLKVEHVELQDKNVAEMEAVNTSFTYLLVPKSNYRPY